MVKKLLLLSCIMFFLSCFLSAAEAPPVNKQNPLSNFMTQPEMDAAVKNMKWWILPINSAFPDFSLDDFYFESQEIHTKTVESDYDRAGRSKPDAKEIAKNKEYNRTQELLGRFDRYTPSKKKFATANPGVELEKKNGKLYLRFAFDDGMGVVITDKKDGSADQVLWSGMNGSFDDMFWLDENRLVVGGSRIYYGKDGSTNIRQELYLYNCNTGIILKFVHDKIFNWDKWNKLPFTGMAKYMTLARDGVDVSHTEDDDY